MIFFSKAVGFSFLAKNREILSMTFFLHAHISFLSHFLGVNIIQGSSDELAFSFSLCQDFLNDAA